MLGQSSTGPKAALHRAAPAERIARADADGHDKGPHAFNAVTGRDLTAGIAVVDPLALAAMGQGGIGAIGADAAEMILGAM
jgi:hypothetical protein